MALCQSSTLSLSSRPTAKIDSFKHTNGRQLLSFSAKLLSPINVVVPKFQSSLKVDQKRRLALSGDAFLSNDLRCPSYLGAKLTQALRKRRQIARQPKGGRAALGFTSEPRVEVERAAGNLLKDAASLLLYQSVLTGAPAQSLLKLLLALRRSDDQVRILEAYGEFFRNLARGGHATWEEYLLHRILAGEDNPFAAAAAKGEAVNQTLLAAAASDLDVLQKLAIMEHSLVAWVADIVTLRPEWKAAAIGTSPHANKALEARTKPQGFGFEAASETEEAGPSQENGSAGGFEGFGWNQPEKSDRGFGGFGVESRSERIDGFSFGPGSIGREESIGSEKQNGRVERSEIIGLIPGGGEDPARDKVASNAEWRAKISGLWKWSEAVPLLESYYRKYGGGVVASQTTLKWQGGKLVTCPPLKEVGSVLSVQRDAFEAILRNLERHAEGRLAHHVLLYGRSGLGKSWVLLKAATSVAKRFGLRTVRVSRSELKSLDKLLEEVRLHPNVRFALLLDDLTFKTGEEGAVAFKQLLEGSYEEWPTNAIVCATSPTRELSRTASSEPLYREGGPIGHHFGLSLELKDLNPESLAVTLKELAGAQKLDLEAACKDISSVESHPSIVTLMHFLRNQV